MRRYALLLVLAVPPCQQAEPAEITGSAAYWKPFLDESGGLAAGAAVRIPVTRRLAVRPEFLAGDIEGYRRILVLASVTFDVTNPANAVVAYVTGGGGFANTCQKPISYCFNEKAALGGAGIRYSLGRRWIADIEFRAGADAFPLITGRLGYRFGRSR